MRYIGTIAQVERLEDYIESMGNYTVLRDGRRDGKGQAKEPSAYSALYEIYLDPRAKEYVQKKDGTFTDMDNKLKLFDFPHVTLRLFYMERDSKAEVNISGKNAPKLFACYPIIAEHLAGLTYATPFSFCFKA